METSLHRQLKRLYAPGAEANEVSVDGYRIDAVAEGRLIEIQCASLAAIRGKITALCERHEVTVVKPVIARKRLVRRKRAGGPVVSRRYSPKRESLLDLFVELVHFTRAFPHARLEFEAVVIEVEEYRIPRKRRRRRQADFRVEDRTLVEVQSRHRFAEAEDFAELLVLPEAPFTTGELAEANGMPRWLAQKAAYFLRETGAWATAGKRGNAWLYAAPGSEERSAA